MAEVESGETYQLVWRIKKVMIDTSGGGEFYLSAGHWSVDLPPVWVEQTGKWATVPLMDMAQIMLAPPTQGVSRREDTTAVWGQYFLDKGIITGVLVPGIGP